MGTFYWAVILILASLLGEQAEQCFGFSNFVHIYIGSETELMVKLDKVECQEGHKGGFHIFAQ